MPLLGIAKLAAQGPLLATKALVDYRELATRRWISRCSSDRMPFQWTINSYRGCELACRYCYARYTHEFLELSPGVGFDTQIFAKRWSTSAFVSELRRIPRQQSLAIGTATDPYQPAERRFGLTRRVLEVLAGDYGRRIILTTKSDLVSRDADLLSEIQRRNTLIVFVTVTTLDRNLARILEPKAPCPERRLAGVQKLAEAGLAVGVTASPVMPGFNDSIRSLDEVGRAAQQAGARYFGASVFFLKLSTWPVFLAAVEEHFPALVPIYREAYRDRAFLTGEYPKRIQQQVEEVRRRYSLKRWEEAPPAEFLPQLPLFAA